MSTPAETAIVRVPRRAAALEPVTIHFTLGPTDPARAAALARKIGLVRAELKLHRLVFVKPHVRRWPPRGRPN